MEHADAGHLSSAAEFDVIAARKIIFAVEFPPRHIHVHSADTVMIMRRHLLQLWEVSGTIAADGIREISADRSGRIGDPGRKRRGLRVQQQPRGFASACGHYDGPRVDALFGVRRFVNVGNAFGFAFFADKNFARHRAGNQRQLSRLHRRGQQHLAGAEIGSRDATATALAAIVARRAPVE